MPPRSLRSYASLITCVALHFLLFANAAHAQRDLRDIPDPDPEIERRSFIVADGFEVNLFVADPLIAKPIQMNFDAQGRLWIASSEVYPHIEPGQVANDKILVVTDDDGDGTAERTEVFADGLLIPTGVIPGDGGAYVANSTELLHMRDTDGDGRADQRRIVLSGFGTEDTHHILHTFRWGPAGHLYFNQSIYIHSHIETPYGVRRLDGGGVWKFQPRTLDLEVYARGFVNPWGFHLDRWGQSFATDGAYGEGINYLFPGATFVTAPGASRLLQGLNPGSPKHCGLEIVDGRHLPSEWQGNMLTNDFRAHRVCRFLLEESGSGYVSREGEELIKTDHVAFRPVDIKMGPDGAIYIADWYNPIIQHGEVDFRDPRRDHVHGRIWRVTAKDRPLVPRPRLIGASTEELLEYLRSPESWTRQMAKRLLWERGEEVLPKLRQWRADIDRSDTDATHLKLEALWTYQALRRVEPSLLQELLQSEDHRARAAAVRVAAAWSGQLPDPLSVFENAVRDSHPRVRLEALHALRGERSAEAARIALLALDQPLDGYLDYALWLTVRDLQDEWLPEVLAGGNPLLENVPHLVHALTAVENAEAVPLLVSLLEEGQVAANRQDAAIAAITQAGDSRQLHRILEHIHKSDHATVEQRAAWLGQLVEAARVRRVYPEEAEPVLREMLSEAPAVLRGPAAVLAGLADISGLLGPLQDVASDGTLPAPTRGSALEALAALEDRATLEAYASTATEPKLRERAIIALATLDVEAAVQHAVDFWQGQTAAEPGTLAAAIVREREGAQALAEALRGRALPADTARRLLRSVRRIAPAGSSLIETLERTSGGNEQEQNLNKREIAEILQRVREHGHAQRGEAVYRRRDLLCQQCHAIGGAGGQVGPDLSSIGASAQDDYLLESLLEPNKKIKENYHSQAIVTEDGRVLTGIVVRETTDLLTLRDAEDQEITLRTDSIDERHDGPSLMPSGLLKSVTRDELVHLVRFLSELGELGEFAVGQDPVVRRWRVLDPQGSIRESLRLRGARAVFQEDTETPWLATYSRVSGELPLGDLPKFYHGYPAQPLIVLQFGIDVAQPGQIQLDFSDPSGISLWLDKKELPVDPPIQADVTSGRHWITVAVRPKGRQDDLRCEVRTAEGSTAQVRIVGGK